VGVVGGGRGGYDFFSLSTQSEVYSSTRLYSDSGIYFSSLWERRCPKIFWIVHIIPKARPRSTLLSLMFIISPLTTNVKSCIKIEDGNHRYDYRLLIITILKQEGPAMTDTTVTKNPPKCKGSRPRRFAILAAAKNVPRWDGPFFEVRVYSEGYNPRGKGHQRRCVNIYNEHNDCSNGFDHVRYAWGRLGRLILSLMTEGVTFIGKNFYEHANDEWIDLNSKVLLNSFGPTKEAVEIGKHPGFVSYTTHKEMTAEARSYIENDYGKLVRFFTTRIPPPKRGTIVYDIYKKAMRVIRTSCDNKKLSRALRELRGILNA